MIFKKWRFKSDTAGKMKMRDMNLVQVTSGETTFIYDVDSQTVVKPEGFLNGISRKDAAPPRYYPIPLSAGSIDRS